MLLYYSLALLLLGMACCFLPKLDEWLVAAIATAPIIYVAAAANASFLTGNY